MLPAWVAGAVVPWGRFNGHPPLGVNATGPEDSDPSRRLECFNGHPPLGVNATTTWRALLPHSRQFQRAPTLGGECYKLDAVFDKANLTDEFQRAPTLGGECYCVAELPELAGLALVSTGTHPWG